jgi:hypothetical protein
MKSASSGISDVWSRELRPFNIRCVSVQVNAKSLTQATADGINTTNPLSLPRLAARRLRYSSWIPDEFQEARKLH